MRRALRLLLSTLPVWTACGPSVAPEGPAPAVDPRRCKPALGTTGSPRTVEEAVALINGLPFPVTAECFIEALDRPLRVEATTSTHSLQKAEGARSPRVLVWTADSLIATIVLDGPARDLVEFGEFVDARRTIKAEIEFPLAAPTSTAAAFERVRNPEHPGITRCFVCHDDEEDEPNVPGSRSSLAVRPRTSTLVDLAALAAERTGCDRGAEPARCAWLDAVFAHGPVERRPFDADLSVF